jgi:hypothetical protein
MQQCGNTIGSGRDACSRHARARASGIARQLRPTKPAAASRRAPPREPCFPAALCVPGIGRIISTRYRVAIAINYASSCDRQHRFVPSSCLVFFTAFANTLICAASHEYRLRIELSRCAVTESPRRRSDAVYSPCENVRAHARVFVRACVACIRACACLWVSETAFVRRLLVCVAELAR